MALRRTKRRERLGGDGAVGAVAGEEEGGGGSLGEESGGGEPISVTEPVGYPGMAPEQAQAAAMELDERSITRITQVTCYGILRQITVYYGILW
eukprot:1182882-Prorocentrum_minimum.AAC.1